MSRISADLADKYLKGERNFTNRTPYEVVLVTPENVSKYLPEN
jgi:hypothetical protein